MVYPVPLGRLHSLPPNATIVHIEMFNAFEALNLFKDNLAAKSVVIHCDNLAVVHTLNSGQAWDEYLGTIARNIWLLNASYDIDLSVVHIPGVDNGLAVTLV